MIRPPAQADSARAASLDLLDASIHPFGNGREEYISGARATFLPRRGGSSQIPCLASLVLLGFSPFAELE